MVKMVAKKLEKKPARVSGQKLTKKVVKKPAHASGQKLTKKVVKKLARVSGPMFTYKCRFCGFVGKSESNDKSARSMRDRHEREEHKGGKRARVAHRMLQSKRYMSVYRAEERGDHDVEPAVENVHVYILSTQRREDEHRMFSETREHLVSRGLKGSNIHMLHGYDVRVSGGDSVRVSGGITKSQCVMWAFLKRFVPNALNRFSMCPNMPYVLFCEDDARLMAKYSASSVHAEASRALPTSIRLGWYQCGGHTIYGCQMASFSKEALECYSSMSDAQLMACDHWWARVKDTRLPCGSRLQQVARTNMARQKTHALQGRK